MRDGDTIQKEMLVPKVFALLIRSRMSAFTSWSDQLTSPLRSSIENWVLNPFRSDEEFLSFREFSPFDAHE
jgi:hypothetical protein